ncbi:DUF2834 domain-containing protein [Pyruvatibacter sp.]|uniref:DUF2834 domain-containing protein n=1 Tax=Pyruvatibacter sp. TaxID=1981328 RepID=UPI0032EC0517
MSRKSIYLALTVIGIVMPYLYFVPWFLENPGDVIGFLALATANPIATMLTWDIILSAVVLTFFALFHLGELGTARIITVIAGTFPIGVSCGLPLLLYFREGRKA